MKTKNKIIDINSPDPLTPKELVDIGFTGIYWSDSQIEMDRMKSWDDTKVVFHKPTKSFDLMKVEIVELRSLFSEIEICNCEDEIFRRITHNEPVSLGSNTIVPLLLKEWGEELDRDKGFGYIPEFWHKNSSVILPFLNTVYSVKTRWRFDSMEYTEKKFCVGLCSRVCGSRSSGCPSYLRFCVRWYPRIFPLDQVGSWSCGAIVVKPAL